MKVITATEAKNAFGELLMDAQSEPVSRSYPRGKNKWYCRKFRYE